MKEFTPMETTENKKKTFTDHNAMAIKLGHKTFAIPLAGTNTTNSLEQIPVLTKSGLIVGMWNIPMLDGRPKVNKLLHRCFRRKRVTNKPNGTFNPTSTRLFWLV